MKKINSLSFFKFFYDHCIKNYFFALLYVVFASSYWALDVQFRQWIGKEILERFDTVERCTALYSMLPWIYIFFVVFALRFVVLNISRYVRLLTVPSIKIGLLKFLMKEVLLKSNILVKKDLDLLSNQIQEVLKNIELMIETIFINMVAHLVLLISSLYIFHENKYLFYAITTLYVLFGLISYIGYKKGVKLNEEILSFDMILYGRFNDIFSNLFNIKLLETEKHEEKELNVFFDQFKEKSVQKDSWYLTIHCLLSLLFTFYHCTCLFLLIWQYQCGFFSKAYFPYIFAINREVTEALWYIIDDFTHLSEYVGKTKNSLEKIFSDTLLIEAPSEESKITQYGIVFDKVNFSYENSANELFKDLSLEIKSGDKVGIIGYSGSGKSSLASLLLNLCPLKSGSIKIGGVDIRLFSHAKLHSMITFMNQNLSLFNRSIKENILYSKLNATDEEIINAAKMANIHEFIEGLPDKYNTVLKFQGREFSYGQKQRILIARAFLRDTPILILDEVTSALDAKSENMVMDSLAKLMKNKTVLVIAHKIKTLFGMDYIIAMNKGQIAEIGTNEDLMKKKSIYNELLNN